ncbi:hypothetical protein LINPERHAP1_LOCUS13297 [Linum perenne]
MTFQGVKMTLFPDHYKFIQGAMSDKDEETVAQYYRAYILDLFGSFIFVDESATYVHLFFRPLLEDLTRVGEYVLQEQHSC